MTLIQHFKELKKRIIYSLVFFVAAFALGLYIAPALSDLIVAPLLNVWDNPTLIYTGIADGLMVQFSLAGFFALFVSIPVILWHIWGYSAPALKKNEKRILLPILIMSPMLFAAGAAFAYFVLLPIMFGFFIDIAADNAQMMPNFKNYLAFSVNLLRAFGLAFQFPLIMVLLNRAGVVSKKQVLSKGRYIVVGVFILATVLTPPDILSQILLALPLLVLFGLSLFFMV